MSTNVRIAIGALALAGLSVAASAQAPVSAQVWDVRFLVEGAGAADVDAVSITLQARVGIRANASASGTANFGVARVGGNQGVFIVQATDPSASVLGQSRFERGLVPGGNDANGQPLAGTFSAFRQGFSPAGTGGSNTDPANGLLTVSGNNARLSNVVHARSTGYDGNPLGVASVDAGGSIVGGDYADLYRFIYIPKLGENGRSISVTVTGISARYLFRIDNLQNGTASQSQAINLPNQSFSFLVPSSGSAAVMALGGLAAARRRRA